VEWRGGKIKRVYSGAFHYGFVDEQLSEWHRKEVLV